MSRVKGLPDISAQSRAFANGRSNTWHGDLYTQTQREKVCGKVLCIYTYIVYVFDLPLMKALDLA